MKSADAVIVGGGLIGLSCGYYLLKRGKSVIIIERKCIGSGASDANCGLVSPSYALPLCHPGVVRKTIWHMIRGDSPLKVGLPPSRRLMAWLARFAGRCNLEDMRAAARARAALLVTGHEWLGKLIEEEELHCGWQAKGHLMVFRNEKEFAEQAEVNKELAALGLAGKAVDGAELREMEPGLAETAHGGYYYACDAHAEPEVLVSELKRIIALNGGEIMEDCPLTGLTGSGDRISDVVTPRGHFSGETFILAMGAWTGAMEKSLHVRLPIQPGWGFSLTFRTDKAPLRFACSFVGKKVVATPFSGRLRIGGIMRFADKIGDEAEDSYRMLQEAAEYYLKEPLHGEPKVRWNGPRPMTFDGVPIIDWVPGKKNLFIAAGHNMLGLSMAASTGRLVSELIEGASPSIDPTPYGISRFG